MKCLKQLHAARKNIVEGHKLRTADIKKSVHSTAQHSTAHDSTSQRNPPLLLSIVCACHRASKKKAKINSDRKFILAHYGIFPGIRGSFAGSWSFFTVIGGRNKKRRSVIILSPMVFPRMNDLLIIEMGNHQCWTVCGLKKIDAHHQPSKLLTRTRWHREGTPSLQRHTMFKLYQNLKETDQPLQRTCHYFLTLL